MVRPERPLISSASSSARRWPAFLPGVQLLIALKTRMLNQQRLGQSQAMKDDIRLVKEIFTTYPYLKTEEHQFAEFFDVSDRGG